MHESFESAQLLLDAAKEDIEKFNVSEGAYINDPNVAAVVKEMDPKTGDKLIKYRILKRPPKELRLLAYRIVGDLRNALDQATSGAAEIVAGEKVKDAHFPFATHPNDLKHKLRKIPAPLHPFFEALQPYASGDGYIGGDTALKTLGTIANPNKHEIALQIGTGANSIHIEEMEGNLFAMPWPKMNSATNELILLRIFPGGTVNYKLTVYPFVALSKSKGAENVSALDMFRIWWLKVRKIITSLEAEATKLAAH